MDTAGKAADHVTYCPVGSSLHLDSAINGNCDKPRDGVTHGHERTSKACKWSQRLAYTAE